jgi:hypothetical protein
VTMTTTPTKRSEVVPMHMPRRRVIRGCRETRRYSWQISGDPEDGGEGPAGASPIAKIGSAGRVRPPAKIGPIRLGSGRRKIRRSGAPAVNLYDRHAGRSDDRADEQPSRPPAPARERADRVSGAPRGRRWRAGGAGAASGVIPAGISATL